MENKTQLWKIINFEVNPINKSKVMDFFDKRFLKVLFVKVVCNPKMQNPFSFRQK